MRMSEEMRGLVGRILLGSLYYNLALALGAVFLCPRLSVFTGLGLGMAAGGIMLLHMAYRSEQAAAETDSNRMRLQLIRASWVRKIGFAAVFLLILLCFPTVIHPAAFVFGALGLKAGVYLLNLRGRKEASV